MQWLGHMSINRKLTTLILVTCALALMLAGGALMAAEWVSSRQALVQDMSAVADLLGRYSSAPLSFHREEDAEEVQKALAAIQADPSVLAVGLYDKNQERFGEFVRPGSSQQCPAKPPADGIQFRGGFLEMAQPVWQDQKRIGTIYLQAGLGRIYDRLKLHAGIVALVLAATIIAVSALSRQLRRPIAQPILNLARVAQRVAQERDYSARATKQSQDEVGTLTDAFNQMLNEIEGRQRSLEHANQSLEAQARKLTESMHILASSSEEILATSMELATGATQTATAIMETTTTLDIVRKTAFTTTQSAQSVAQGAQTVVQVALNGKKSVEETIQSMGDMRRQVDSIAESMARLIEQTQNIGQIIATVDDFTAQSNLLAVNASIEAAKAGEYGKGFTVVAQEVRNLAEQSRQATNQVRKILNDIQKATQTAVVATEQGSKVAESGVKLSSQSGESIQSLSQSVMQAAQAAMHIATSSQEQMTGTDQVATAMESIHEASAQNAAGAKKLEAAAQNLKRLGEQLKECLETNNRHAAL